MIISSVLRTEAGITICHKIGTCDFASAGYQVHVTLAGEACAASSGFCEVFARTLAMTWPGYWGN